MSDTMMRRTALIDMRARLFAAAIPGVGSNVFISRVTSLAAPRHPAILLYAPDLAAAPVGTSWAWGGTINLVLEIHVRFAPAATDGLWAEEAERISDAALAALMGDDEWRRLWTAPPPIKIQQFLRGGPGVDLPQAGETVTLTLQPRRRLVYPITPESMEGADADIAVARPDGTIPAQPDITLTLERPA